MAWLFCLFVSPQWASSSASHVWFYSPNPKAVVLVTHGLNLKPSAMDTLAKELQSSGADVLRIGLSGHQSNIEEFKKVTRLGWLAELNQALHVAKNHAYERKLPFYFIGYSLSALLMADLLESNKTPLPIFDRMVLLAPALEIRDRSHWIKILSIFGDGFLVPSKCPVDYRSGPSTPMAAYKVLFQSEEQMKKIGLNRLKDVPTLMLVDPDDELVNFSGLSKWVSPHWKLVPIQKFQAPLKPNYHHLMVDEPSLGVETWKFMRQQIMTHFSMSQFDVSP